LLRGGFIGLETPKLSSNFATESKEKR